MYWFRGDKIILLVMAILSIISLLAVATSTNQFLTHLLYMLLCWGFVILFYKIDYKVLSRFAYPALFLAFMLLILTLFTGSDKQRSIQIGNFSFQTFFLIGFVVIFFLSKYIAMNLNEKDELSWKDLVVILSVLVFFCGLMVKSNFSTAFLLGFTSLIVLYIGKIPFKYLAAILGIATIGLTIIFATPFGQKITRTSTGIQRIMRHPLATNFDKNPKTQEEREGVRQLILSQAAIARNSFAPAGPGQGVIKRSLDQRDTDFVFATVVEEFGIYVGGFLIMLYLILFFRSIIIAKNSEGPFGQLLAVGIGSWITCQALVHIGVNCGLVPATGQTLPFISRGGSSLIVTGIMLGILLNISRNGIKKHTN